jgi:hypothetical protein
MDLQYKGDKTCCQIGPVAWHDVGAETNSATITRF